MLVFENEIASVFHEETGYLRLVMRPGPYPITQMRAIFLQTGPYPMSELQDVFRHTGPTPRTGIYKTLLDLRLTTPISTAEQKWVHDTITLYPSSPLFRDRVAILVAHDVFARLTTLPLLARAFHHADAYKSFDDEARAKQWLLA